MSFAESRGPCARPACGRTCRAGTKGLTWSAFGHHQGTKNDLEDFERQAYIDKVKGGIVDFDDKGRRHRDLHEKILVEDVRWTSELLAKLAPKQWQDAFRAAHYDQETAARYISRLLQKVEEGRRLQ